PVFHGAVLGELLAVHQRLGLALGPRLERATGLEQRRAQPLGRLLPHFIEPFVELGDAVLFKVLVGQIVVPCFYAEALYFSQRLPSGGTRTCADAGWPVNGFASACTVSRLPTPDPP